MMFRRSTLLLTGALATAAVAAWAAGALAAAAPAVSTDTPREVTATSASLVGTVNPAGQGTTYAFEYGQSTQYAGETAATSAGSGSAPVAATATISGLRPGTTYHFRVIASNAGGTSAGSDVAFTTPGLAPPAAALPTVTTAPAAITDAHDAVLGGTIGPSATPVRYWFELGTGQPYDVQTVPVQFGASSGARSVTAPVGGLQGGRTYHYRLVVAGEGGELAAGPDMSFATSELGRIDPRGLEVKVSPTIQRRLPATVTVAGKVLLPSGVSGTRACEGYVTITFRRAHEVAIQVLRAGLRSDCTFSLPVRFSSARRLHGGHILVEVVFPGNGVLHRYTARQYVQIG